MYNIFPFATPSFLSGMARTLDLFATFDSYNTSSGEEADARAIRSDWYMVGTDLYKAMEQAEKNKPEQLTLPWENEPCK